MMTGVGMRLEVRFTERLHLFLLGRRDITQECRGPRSVNWLHFRPFLPDVTQPSPQAEGQTSVRTRTVDCEVNFGGSI